MSSFDLAIPLTLENEGGYVNNPKDPGGATNFGISLRFLQQNNIHINDDGIIDVQDIKNLTKEQAIEIYRRYFWDRNSYAEIGQQRIANKLFDIGVLHGPSRVIAIAQTCLWARGIALQIDGILGRETIKEINALIDWPGYYKDLKMAISSSLAGLAIVNTNLREDLKGWVHRAFS